MSIQQAKKAVAAPFNKVALDAAKQTFSSKESGVLKNISKPQVDIEANAVKKVVKDVGSYYISSFNGVNKVSRNLNKAIATTAQMLIGKPKIPVTQPAAAQNAAAGVLASVKNAGKKAVSFVANKGIIASVGKAANALVRAAVTGAAVGAMGFVSAASVVAAGFLGTAITATQTVLKGIALLNKTSKSVNKSFGATRSFTGGSGNTPLVGKQKSTNDSNTSSQGSNRGGPGAGEVTSPVTKPPVTAASPSHGEENEPAALTANRSAPSAAQPAPSARSNSTLSTISETGEFDLSKIPVKTSFPEDSFDAAMVPPSSILSND